MPDAKSKAKVQRLLNGDFRAGDLTDLFLFARDHCDGRQTVKEIGDFAAHHNERNKGIITDSTRNWFTTARFHIASYRPNQPREYDPKKLPPETRDYLKIALDKIDAKAVTQKMKMSRADAKKAAFGLAERLTQNVEGTWAIPQNITKSELSLFELVASTMVVRPAFDDDRLVDDFLATLKSNDLISKDEIVENRESLSALIKLYAVSSMHNCIIRIGNDNTAQLKGIIHNGQQDKISVNCAVPAGTPDKPNIKIAFDIFSAKLNPAAHCAPELLKNSPWDFEVEVAPDKRLSPLR